MQHAIEEKHHQRDAYDDDEDAGQSTPRLRSRGGLLASGWFVFCHSDYLQSDTLSRRHVRQDVILHAIVNRVARVSKGVARY